MSRSKRVGSALAEGAALHVLLTVAGLGILTGWARVCARMKRSAHGAP